MRIPARAAMAAGSILPSEVRAKGWFSIEGEGNSSGSGLGPPACVSLLDWCRPLIGDWTAGVLRVEIG